MKKFLYIILLSFFITIASLIVYKPEVNIPCLIPPCPYSPAGRGFLLTYWIEDNSPVNYGYNVWIKEAPLRGKFGRFQPIDFIANIFIYTLLLASFYFGYSKFFKKSKKK